jgi:hypothetical protein
MMDDDVIIAQQADSQPAPQRKLEENLNFLMNKKENEKCVAFSLLYYQ